MTENRGFRLKARNTNFEIRNKSEILMFKNSKQQIYCSKVILLRETVLVIWILIIRNYFPDKSGFQLRFNRFVRVKDL